MKIDKIPISEIIPYSKNPRRNEKAIAEKLLNHREINNAN